MDWVVKASTSDVSELGEEENNTRFIALNGSNDLVDGGSGGGLLSDLSVGRLRDSQDGAKDEERKGLTMLPLPIGLKKAHCLSSTKNVLCLVDGCSSDLSKCREYHRRHRVCERHSKTPIVIIKGREQRFCQQCSRFHPLEEFDEVKRSCRKRLDGHNRRRRKPQPETLYMSSQNFLSDCKGASWLRFGGPQAHESRGGTGSGISISWPDNDNRPHSNIKAFSVDKEFPFYMNNKHGQSIYQNPEVAISRNHVKANGISDSNCSRLIVSDKLTYLEESKCALSLLSTNHTQAARTIISPATQQDFSNLSQSTSTNLHFDDLYPYPCPPGMEEKSVDALVTPDSSNIYDCISNGISPLFQGAI